MATKRVGWAAGLAAALVAAAGCGDGPAMGDVTGTVTVDGKPVDLGSLSFIPADGKSPTAGGDITDGRYSVRVPVGTSKVEIRVPKTSGKKKPQPKGGYQTQGETVEESLPAKYNMTSELTLDVRPGKNEKNWDLATK